MSEEKEKITRGQVIQIVFNLILIVAIGSLIYTTVIVGRYKAMLYNPLGFSLDHFGINQCSCQSYDGKYINIPSIHYNNSINSLVNLTG